MNHTKLIITLLIASILASCGRTYTLSGKEFEWIPYNGNETLVFSSNTGDIDTIFILKKDILWGYPNELSLGKYQVVRIFCRHTDKTTGNNYRYLENDLVSLEAIKGNPRINFSLNTKDATFYNSWPGFSIDSLNQETPLAIQTKHKTYNDVYIITGEDWLNFKQRSDYVTKLYWSKSEGLIRYDKQDSVYWDLTNKYSP